MLRARVTVQILDKRGKPMPFNEELSREVAEAVKEFKPSSDAAGAESNPTDAELASRFGRVGGKALLQKYGPDHFREMGKRGGKKTLETKGKEYFTKIGKEGGMARSRKKKEQEAQPEA